jgi:hypothetical protein
MVDKYEERCVVLVTRIAGAIRTDEQGKIRAGLGSR